jgi:hypothetical protein
MPTVTTQPQELVSGFLTLWMAPIGTAVPLLDTAPPGPWVLVGTNGANDYDSTGLTVTHNQTLATFTPVGTTAPVAVWRTDEQLEVSVTLADTSAPSYAQSLNNAAVTTVNATTGLPGESDITLLQGVNVGIFALLCRGVSALNQTMNAQYAIPAVYQSSNPAPVYKKGAPAELALTYATILDPNGGGFGKFQQQSAART